MKRAFTLLELLFVVGLMGLLGTVSVGGYRAMQRGMEERGVMQSVNSLVRAAYQRAQIDRQPTAVYFWNETLQSDEGDDHEIVVGRAVAIRRHGRFSDKCGNKLVDEYADLNRTYRALDVDDNGNVSGSQESNIYLYPMEKLTDIQSDKKLRRSIVRGDVVDVSDEVFPLFLTGQKNDDSTGGKGASSSSGNNGQNNTIPAFAFELVDAGGVTWKAGMAYGLEFAQLELPKNYIFGTDYSKRADDPVREAGTLTFTIGNISSSSGKGGNGGTSGRKTIEVYSLRPNGVQLEKKKVASSDDPEGDLK